MLPDEVTNKEEYKEYLKVIGYTKTYRFKSFLWRLSNIVLIPIMLIIMVVIDPISWVIFKRKALRNSKVMKYWIKESQTDLFV